MIINMIHGAPGENGQLAGMLELLQIPQSSCSSYTAGLTYNKRDCLAVARSLNIPTARFYTLDQGDDYSTETIEQAVGFPCFVKANSAGSSFGISKVYKPKNFHLPLKMHLKKITKYSLKQHLLAAK